MAELNPAELELTGQAENTENAELAAAAAELLTDRELAAERETGFEDEEPIKTVTAKKTVRKKKDERQEQSKNQNQNQSHASSTGSAGSAAGAGAGAGAAAAVVAVVYVASGGMFGASDVSLGAFDARGTSIDYSVAIHTEYTPEEGSAADFGNLDTGLRLLIYGNDGTAETIILSTGNSELSVDVEATPLETAAAADTAADPQQAAQAVAGAAELSEGEEVPISYSLDINFRDAIEGLRQKTQYTFEVIGTDSSGGMKSYVKKSVKTTGPVTEFRSLTYQCRCSIDGTMLVYLDYDDDGNYYYDYHYDLISAATGAVVRSGDITDPKAAQVIDVSTLEGKVFTLELTLHTSDPEDLDEGVDTIIMDFHIEL